MKILKRFCALLFLALFLFPLAQKELHALEHADDFHCTSSSSHFHETEHTCSICDFIVPLSIVSSQPVFDFSPIAYSCFSFFYEEAAVISFTPYFVSLRAPPAAC